jgi:hypothetical protein
MTSFTILRRFFVLACLLTIATATTAGASAASDELEAKVREARERFSDRQNLLAVYHLKTEAVGALHELESARIDVEAYARRLKIVIDGYPARRNNLQQADYNEWLAARERLTSLDQAMNGLHLRMKEIDEQALKLTQNNLKRPLPTNRRDIQVVFPMVEQRCNQAFRELKELADDASKEQQVSRDRVVMSVMSALGSKREVEAEYGSTVLFMETFRRYCSGKSIFEVPKSKPKATPKLKPRGRR